MTKKKYDVLVTGASGFIGQFLCNKLIECGFSVIGIDKIQAQMNCDLLIYDLTNDSLELDFECNSCIHLASAVGGILFNNNTASDMVSYNNSINENINTLLKKINCERLFFFSSINVFENTNIFIEERLKIHPNITQYAISKAYGEKYFEKYFKNFIVIRPTNVFGMGQSKTHNTVGESHVIPDLLQKLSDSKIVNVMGDGTQIRNFVHVSDITNFIIKNIYLDGIHYFNLRSNILITIRDLAVELAHFKKTHSEFFFQKEYMKYETLKMRNFENTISTNHGWNPRVSSISEGMTF